MGAVSNFFVQVLCTDIMASAVLYREGFGSSESCAARTQASNARVLYNIYCAHKQWSYSLQAAFGDVFQSLFVSHKPTDATAYANDAWNLLSYVKKRQKPRISEFIMMQTRE